MSTVLYNPTNEMFRITFGGKSFLLKGERNTDDDRKAPSKVKVTDACGRHCVNELGPRGLCTLDFGDDEEEIAKQGTEVNKAFKVRQIEVYNQQNEARKQSGLQFNTPTKTLIKYAQELGIKLSEPYRVEDLAITQANTLKEENATLREEMAEMRKQMSELIAAVKDQIGIPEPPTPEVTLEDPKPEPAEEKQEPPEFEGVVTMSEDVEGEDEDLADLPVKKTPKRKPKTKKRTTKKR